MAPHHTRREARIDAVASIILGIVLIVLCLLRLSH